MMTTTMTMTTTTTTTNDNDDGNNNYSDDNDSDNHDDTNATAEKIGSQIGHPEVVSAQYLWLLMFSPKITYPRQNLFKDIFTCHKNVESFIYHPSHDGRFIANFMTKSNII